MKIVSWNILQGGGRRSPDIVDTLKQLDADVLALQEFRHGKSKPLLEQGFDDLGYENRLLPEPGNLVAGVENSKAKGNTLNSVGLVSRYPMEGEVLLPAGADRVDAALALQANVSIIDADVADINIVVVHLPHKQKQLPYFKTLLTLAPELLQGDSILIGDFNCGIPFEDSETKSFHATRQFQSLLSQGWVDAWRSRNPKAREFSWISSRKGNGFRYDHALVSPALDSRINSINYLHEPRENGFSDHSALIVDID